MFFLSLYSFSEIPNVAPLVYRTQTRRLFSDIFSGAKMNDFSNVIYAIKTYIQIVYYVKVSDFLDVYSMRY
jgi:hypothetical protein